jgi:hypothetical protein
MVMVQGCMHCRSASMAMLQGMRQATHLPLTLFMTVAMVLVKEGRLVAQDRAFRRSLEKGFD